MPLLIPPPPATITVALDPAVYAHVERSAQLAKMTVPDWLARHLATYFSIR